MADSPGVETARKALGQQLALLRQAAGYNQHEFAPLTHYGRSTIANVEVGRQNVPRAFWERCDQLLQADGTLLARYDGLQVAKREQYQAAARSVAGSTARLEGASSNRAVPTAASVAFALRSDDAPLVRFPRAVDRSGEARHAPNQEGADAGSERVDRRNFLGVSTGVAAVAALGRADFLSTGEPVVVPRTVRASDIQQVREAARLFGSWDHTYGGGTVRATVTGQLRWAGQLLHADCPTSLRVELFGAVGCLSGVCGFMAFDAYAHADARRMFAFGLACAEESGDWQLRAKVLSNMARQAIWCGDPDAGLTQAELALVRADRLSGSERAMLQSARARALAKLGQVQATLAAVGAADDAFSQASSVDDPPWMAYYDQAQHHGDTGHALFDLAIHGYDPAPAATRLRTAVAGHSDAYARSRAISGTKLASLTMTCADPLEAVAVAGRALDDAGRLRSRRTADDLRELGRLAAAHAGVAEVRDLRERMAVVVAAQ